MTDEGERIEVCVGSKCTALSSFALETITQSVIIFLTRPLYFAEKFSDTYVVKLWPESEVTST